MQIDLIIFDFDGVIADSEQIACGVVAEMVHELGGEMTIDEALDRFLGRRLSDVVTTIEVLIGRHVPSLAARLTDRTLYALERDLRGVVGAEAFIRTHRHIAQCIASSSSMQRLRLCLHRLGLDEWFGDNVFSADQVTRGKPYPDLFIHAAGKMGVPAEQCIVIEDSPGGVRAGLAANMRVVGLTAGGHVRAGHGERLLEAGARTVASSYDDLDRLIQQWSRER